MKPQAAQATAQWSGRRDPSGTTTSRPSNRRDSTRSKPKGNAVALSLVRNGRPDHVLGRVARRYKVLTELGRGGMGVVYKAEDTKLDRLVALKFLPSEWSHDETAGRRLIREARAASATDHPNVCTIYDIDSTETGQLFIVMAHYDGQTLHQKLEQCPLETREILDIALQTAEALEAAHARGIVHRDIKPGNIFVCGTGVVKVLDFGLAERLRVASGIKAFDAMDVHGSPLGTPNYMAPERILQMPADPRSDLFSLGVVIYEMATKRRPFAGTSVTETVNNVLDSEPLPLTWLSPTRPKALEKVVSKALAKRVDDRFQSALELRHALQVIGRQKCPVAGSNLYVGFRTQQGSYVSGYRGGRAIGGAVC